ncbi:hypothetical protein FRC06_003284 [Ceratobasidium sp. 370]|nr:hypothetical protein FRC06_003284 [Ceratobasidium sp. 370]
MAPRRGCLSTPQNPSATTKSYDPLNLPLRTERNLTSQLRQMERAQTMHEYDELAEKYGISGPSLLDRILSIQRPTSYPHEFLHLFLLNHGLNLAALWTNSYSGISNTGSENYLISRTDWVALGRGTGAATDLLPSAFVRPLPDIRSTRRLYCGGSWSLWLIYIGPIVLRGWLATKYYNHYLELVTILKCLLEVNNSKRRIKQLRKEIAGHVERFDK